MTSLILAVIVLAAQPEKPNLPQVQPPAAEKDAPPARSGKELETAVREALRQRATVKADDSETAAREFLGLLDELKNDKVLPRSTNDELRSTIRNRLAKLVALIQKHTGAKKDRGAIAQPNAGDGANGLPPVLGQMMGGGQGGAMGQGGMAGPGGFAPNRPGANAGPPDAGQDLIDMIHKTIAPESWDINGGKGSIYYWQTRHALVIRASSEVHEQIGGLMEQLNR
jgi:hypothetical protein